MFGFFTWLFGEEKDKENKCTCCGGSGRGSIYKGKPCGCCGGSGNSEDQSRIEIRAELEKSHPGEF